MQRLIVLERITNYQSLALCVYPQTEEQGGGGGLVGLYSIITCCTCVRVEI
jgi:hypothetical protein